MNYPRSFALKPPRSLRLVALALLIGAVFLCLTVPDRYGGIGALSLAAGAAALWRATLAFADLRLVLLADGRWIPPGSEQAHALSASSTCLGGVFWLHGRHEDGQRSHLMLMPDSFGDHDAYRCLCVWYRLASSARD